MDTNEVITCPVCENHCPVEELKCHKGRNHALENGLIPDDRSLDEKLYARLRDCARFMYHKSEGKNSQQRILSILDEKGGISQRELMDMLDVKAGSLSEVLGKLEAKGYITRNKKEDDRRSMDIALTDEGKAALSELQVKPAAEGPFAALAEEEKTQLEQLLGKLAADWKAKNEADESDKGRGRERNHNRDRSREGFERKAEGRDGHERKAEGRDERERRAEGREGFERKDEGRDKHERRGEGRDERERGFGKERGHSAEHGDNYREGHGRGSDNR